MADALFTQDDYREALLALLPTGRVWPKDPDSVQYATMDAVAPTFVRLDQRAQNLLVDAFPSTTYELLPQWEATLGLPDPCEGPDQTVPQRQAQVVAKLYGPRGQSVAYFQGVLERLGYTNATITQFAATRADIATGDSDLLDDRWAFAWQVNLPDLVLTYACGDTASAGDPLLAVGNGVAACILSELKPAHTTIIFSDAAAD